MHRRFEGKIKQIQRLGHLQRSVEPGDVRQGVEGDIEILHSQAAADPGRLGLIKTARDKLLDPEGACDVAL